jgi:hypothetical protein
MKRLLWVLASLVFVPGCSVEQPKVAQPAAHADADVRVDMTRPLVMVHNKRRMADGRWTADIWTNGSDFTSDPIGLTLRITDSCKLPTNLPKVMLTAVLYSLDNGGEPIRRLHREVAFQTTANQEFSEIAFDAAGNTVHSSFTGAPGIWQAVLPDVLDTNPRNRLLPRGRYTMAVEIELEDGPRFRFPQMAIDCISVSRDPKHVGG